jgi:hypothetical protein
VRHGAGGVRDDGRVAGVGLRLARVEVSDPPHRQARQIGDLAARVAGHRQRQSADRGRLVHDDQDAAELLAELVEDLPQLRFGVGQLLVEDLLAGRGGSVSVVSALPDIQAQEDAYLVVLVQAVLPNGACGAGLGVGLGRASTLCRPVARVRRALRSAGR